MRVIVVEDQALLRDGLVRLFTDKNHDVVGSLGDTSGLDELVTATEPDLVVLDLRMPPTFTDEGATAARTLKQTDPNWASYCSPSMSTGPAWSTWWPSPASATC